MKWPEVEVRKVVRIRAGGISPADYPEEEFELFSIPGFDNGAPEICRGSDIKSNKTIVKPGDVLFSKLNPRIPRVWIIKELNNRRRQISSTQFWPLVPNTKQIASDFLHRLLLWPSFRERFSGGTEAATKSRSRIKPYQLLDQLIPVPPLSEQRRIIEILDQADALRKKRAQADTKAARILTALFYELFGDPAMNPKEWPTTSLGNVADIGTQLVDPNQPQFLDLPHIGGEQIEKETGRILSSKLVRDSDLRSDKFHFTSEHILYSKIRPYLNKVAFPRFEGVCSADIYPIKPRDGRLSHWYLVGLLRSPAFLAYAKVHSERLRMPKLNREQLGAFLAPLPDPAVLEIFERQAEQIQRLEKARFEQADRISTLFNVLLHRAFSGDLTAKWREAHTKELLAEMEAQSKSLEVSSALA